MSTRGSVAVTCGGRTLIAYVHGDAYPERLGLRMLALASTFADPAAAQRARHQFDGLAVVDEAAPMSAAHRRIARESGYVVDPGESPNRDYYSGLRDLQGFPEAYLAVGLWPVPGKDAADAESWRENPGHLWGYEIDLDEPATFDVFRKGNAVRLWWGLAILPDPVEFLHEVREFYHV